jgi:hypothetical protein
MSFNFLTRHFDGWKMLDSSGNGSSTLTFATLSFLVTIFAIVGPMLSDSINKPDNTLVLGSMAATFLSYVNRRNTQDKLNNGTDAPSGVIARPPFTPPPVK